MPCWYTTIQHLVLAHAQTSHWQLSSWQRRDSDYIEKNGGQSPIIWSTVLVCGSTYKALFTKPAVILQFWLWLGSDVSVWLLTLLRYVANIRLWCELVTVRTDPQAHKRTITKTSNAALTKRPLKSVLPVQSITWWAVSDDPVWTSSHGPMFFSPNNQSLFPPPFWSGSNCSNKCTILIAQRAKPPWHV